MPTLDGSAPLELSPGTQPGEVLTLRGEGMPTLGRGRRGNLRVVVNVLISCSIQLPDASSAIPMPIAFGTNDSVASWICVTDWNSDTANPISSAVSRTGAPSFAASVMACSPSWTTWLSVIWEAPSGSWTRGR